MIEKTLEDKIKEFSIKKDKFILDENNNVIPADLLEWSNFLESNTVGKRRVARDNIDGKLISTVFLGLDHSFDGSLHIFETMVFENEYSGNDIYCDRYSTWKDAEEGHKRAVKWVEDGCCEHEWDNTMMFLSNPPQIKCLKCGNYKITKMIK